MGEMEHFLKGGKQTIHADSNEREHLCVYVCACTE